MTKELTLNSIEHHLLSIQVDDIEPLFILYADTKRDIRGASLDLVLEALMKLIDIGFSECIINRRGRWQQIKNLTLNDLKQRFESQSEEEKLQYPKHTNEYYFKITENGRIEEAKEIYKTYYL